MDASDLENPATLRWFISIAKDDKDSLFRIEVRQLLEDNGIEWQRL